MAKRKLKTSRVKLKDTDPRKNQARDSSTDEQVEGTVDYGGLPQRDLKKNLGCG